MLLSSCKDAGKTSIKLAHGLDPTHPVHLAMVNMAQDLEKRSGGAMELNIYPSGQLGSEQQCVELLQIGSLAMTKVSAAAMEGFADEYRVLGLPYIFASKEHAFRVLDGRVGQDILLASEQYNIRGLCFYDAGARSYYTVSKPVYTPDDLQSLKIRVMKSQTAMNMVQAQGGSPTPISWGELYTALQSKVVDGAENNPPSFYTSGHYEICKYYCLNEHTRVPDVLIFSTVIWDRLTEQEKTWLQEAATSSVKVQRQLWSASEQESMAKVLAAGVEVIYPNKGLFEEKTKDIFDTYKEQAVLYDLIQRIQSLR